MSFFCHYCENIIDGKQEIKLALYIGITFNVVSGNSSFPGLDFCHECAFTFLNKFREGKEIRMEQEYQKKSIDWIRLKVQNLKKFQPEAKTWDDQAKHSGFSKGPAFPAARNQQKGAASVRSARRTQRQMELSFLKTNQN